MPAPAPGGDRGREGSGVTIVEQLQAFCGGGYPTPMSVNANGRRWVFATDSYLMAAIESDEEAEMAEPKLGKAAAGFIERALHAEPSIPTSPAKLVEWTGVDPICTECAGSGIVECKRCQGQGRHSVTCGDCDEEHSCFCRRCENGKAECKACQAPRAGTIRNGAFDLKKVRAAMSLFGGEAELLIGGAEFDTQPLLARSPGKIMVLMGISGEPPLAVAAFDAQQDGAN